MGSRASPIILIMIFVHHDEVKFNIEKTGWIVKVMDLGCAGHTK
jgi:hypothetical protein